MSIEMTSEIVVRLVQSCGGDAMVCAAARVSVSGEDTSDGAEQEGLIRYLMNQKHGTPFEHASMTFFWVPRADRKLVPKPGSKAARPEFVAGDLALHLKVVERLRVSYAASYGTYLDLLEMGVAREVARACLPFAIYSSCYVTCNPRSLMAFLALRTHEVAARHVSYPQAEIEEAARACETVFRAGWPVTHAAFEACGRVAP